MDKSHKKVFVAMSGGVDSSVAAFLLKKYGYKVTGVYMKNWSDPLADECLWKDDIRDFRRVCRILGIPSIIENFEDEYRKKIVNYLLAGYKRGITPNPDMLCNREIKFKLFQEKALSLGANYIATGHYVIKKTDHRGNEHLYEAIDKNKDQSYFLALLTQKQLKKSLFPIGNLTKHQVRKIAKKARLPVYDKPDSQGICFVGKVKFKDFMKKFIKPKPGLILTTTGKVIGRHEGVQFYTIGQRHGLGIGGGIPYYIVKKELKTNKIVVGIGSSDQKLYSTKASVRDFSWISGTFPKKDFICSVRIRYRQSKQKCLVSSFTHGIKIKFSTKQRAVSPGQFAVLYKKNEMLGGGAII